MNLVVWCDGCAILRKTAWYGYIIETEDADLISSRGGVAAEGHKATANLAEWESVLRGLMAVKAWSLDHQGRGHITVCNDAKNTIMAIKGKYRVHNPDLIVISDKAKKYWDQLKEMGWTISARLVRGDENKAHSIVKSTELGRSPW